VRDMTPAVLPSMHHTVEARQKWLCEPWGTAGTEVRAAFWGVAEIVRRWGYLGRSAVLPLRLAPARPGEEE